MNPGQRLAQPDIMKTQVIAATFLVMVISVLFSSATAGAQEIDGHRLLVLTDIEADPDDSQTLVRLLLYSNDIDIEGLIATTSTHQRARVAPETIHRIIDAYGMVQPNLLKHHPGFPEADALHALVKQGLPLYGMEAVGKGMDTQGISGPVLCGQSG
jgi:hypothetical protein